MPIGPLFAVFRLLSGTTAAVCPGDIFFLLGLGLHLVLVWVAFRHALEYQTAAGDNIVNVCHVFSFIVDELSTCPLN